MSKERYECGQRLRHLREKNNYTQESLSEILESINIKISERDIRNYESGKICQQRTYYFYQIFSAFLHTIYFSEVMK